LVQAAAACVLGLLTLPSGLVLVFQMPAQPERNYDNMSVKELKARIVRGGLSHSDCFEVTDLKARAEQADAARSNSSGTTVAAQPKKKAQEPETSLRERKGGSKKATEEETEMLEQVAQLVEESRKVRGRDASVILSDAEKLKEHVAGATLTAGGKKQLLEQLEDVTKNLAFETYFEKHCARFIQLVFLAVTIVPALLTFGEYVVEFATRPEMVVAPAKLANVHAVVTGGCGALGLELAIMLANSGAGVYISCHGQRAHEEDEVDARLGKLRLLRTGDSGSRPKKGWIEVLPLQLESFASVREFAGRVAKEAGSLDILVHNAATKEGCSRTVDGHEMVTQVNYLSPFLLTHLLLPSLRKGGARVVYVTCDAGLQQPDWLPWPLRRTQAELLPRVDLEGLKQRPEGEDASKIIGDCAPLVEYANSKLAIIAHSHELNRRLSSFGKRGVSHAVNPGSMDTPFSLTESVPAAKASMRSSMMGYLPPVFIANKIYGATIAPVFSRMSRSMRREITVGAKSLFHVATSAALRDQEHGGGLFSDTIGAFTECGNHAAECGRVPLEKQPALATDEEFAADLWSRTKSAIGHRHLKPLPEGGEPDEVLQEAAGMASVEEPEVESSENTQHSEKSEKPPMTIKFASEQNGVQQLDFSADGSMADLFKYYGKQLGIDRQSMHFTIWGQDVDLEKTVADTWDSLQLGEDDAIDVRAAH